MCERHTAAEKLTPAQHRAAMLIGSGWTVTDAAAEVGVSRETIYRWRKGVDGFQSTIDASMLDAGAKLDAQVEELVSLSVLHLLEQMQNGREQTRTKIALALMQRAGLLEAFAARIGQQSKARPSSVAGLSDGELDALISDLTT